MKHDRNLQPRPHGPGHGRRKRVMSVQQALEWAFRVEHAQLELPKPETDGGEPQSFGLQHVLAQRAALGTAVDGGRYKLGSYTHPDAEVIAAIVAGLPDSLGGKRMAIRVAELARAGLTPNWMPGATPRCVPVDIKRNRHGDRAVSEVVGTERVLVDGKWRTVEVRACPVRFSPDKRQIDSARQSYEDWWKALDWVREGVIAGRMLRELELSEAMPSVRPWTRGGPRSQR
jgi:hypothetical protein